MKIIAKTLHKENSKLFSSKNIEPTLLSSCLQYAKSVVWHPEGYLLVSDIVANKIYRFYLNGVVDVLMLNSGGPYIIHTHLSKMIGANGLAIDANNDLIICQHGNHSISKLYTNKNMVVLCSSYNGKPLNSPNEMALKSNGAVYFTDPPYGLKNEILNTEVFQFHAGIYKYENNQLSLLTDQFKYPNGICFSKNEKYLYVSNNDVHDKRIYKFMVDKNGELFNKELFAEVDASTLKIDKLGNLYALLPDGINIYNAEATLIATLKFSERPTHIAFGGKENNTLFITTIHSIYYIEMAENKLSAIKPTEILKYDIKSLRIDSYLTHAS
jgi:gluconolactonase